jgi:MarR family 2-MHQ and catechol resistance regulon transcriptional repressor
MPAEIDYNHPVHNLWIILDQTYVATSKCQEAAFAKAGLTLQQYRVLMVINFAQQPVTQTDMARHLDRNANSISLIIDRMEKSGLVKRVRDLKDRRALRLTMTAKGEELFKRATAYGLELEERMLSCYSEEETKLVTELLGKLRGRALAELAPKEADRDNRTDSPPDIAHHHMTKTGKGKKLHP